MYRLATMHRATDRQTDGQTDRQHYHTSSRSYCMQYDWLTTPVCAVRRLFVRWSDSST